VVLSNGTFWSNTSGSFKERIQTAMPRCGIWLVRCPFRLP